MFIFSHKAIKMPQQKICFIILFLLQMIEVYLLEKQPYETVRHCTVHVNMGVIG